ncbi:MAG: glucose-1-phosphate adenylyltransferase subunit GlgD [Oscillospiraceae bacterium]|nr:glucose-1-phosphate adenylyltransferase subunit GlgD [Oscillospiraceae bacterium]
MGTTQNILGLVFASVHEESLVELTKNRTLGAVPFGGRYRLIDFPISNYVNSGISQVGVLTNHNYGSLLDHIGSGREWDLARKKGGLHLLPPYSSSVVSQLRGKLDALANIRSFVEHAAADYVVLSDCDVVTNIDFRQVVKEHIASGADITAVYAKNDYDEATSKSAVIYDIDDAGFVTDVMINPPMKGKCNQGLNMYVMGKEFLLNVVKKCISRNRFSLRKDVLQDTAANYKIKGYEHKTFFVKIESTASYFAANLALLDTEKRNALFQPNAPILTKTKDNAPVHFGLESEIKNSLIADGCIIEGKVENCVLFRGVKIGKGSVVRDSIITQSGVIGERCSLRNVITDKNVAIADERVLTGSAGFPAYFVKGAEI